MPSIMKPGGKKQNGAPLPSRRPPTLQPPRQRSELHIWVALMSGGDGAGVEKVAPLAREYKFIAKKSLRGGWYYGSLRGFVRIVFKSGAHSSARRRGAWPLSTASPPRASRLAASPQLSRMHFTNFFYSALQLRAHIRLMHP